MNMLNFTIHLSNNATVVALGICATLCYIAWTGMKRAKQDKQA